MQGANEIDDGRCVEVARRVELGDDEFSQRASAVEQWKEVELSLLEAVVDEIALVRHHCVDVTTPGLEPFDLHPGGQFGTPFATVDCCREPIPDVDRRAHPSVHAECRLVDTRNVALMTDERAWMVLSVIYTPTHLEERSER
jgi:hypothetical protein